MLGTRDTRSYFMLIQRFSNKYLGNYLLGRKYKIWVPGLVGCNILFLGCSDHTYFVRILMISYIAKTKIYFEIYQKKSMFEL